MPTRAWSSRARARSTTRLAMVSARRSGWPAQTASAKRSFSCTVSSPRLRRSVEPGELFDGGREGLQVGAPAAWGEEDHDRQAGAAGAVGELALRRADVAVGHHEHAARPLL